MTNKLKSGTAAVIAASSLALAAALPAAASLPDAPFLSQIATAMNTMMSAMEIKPSGDVDRDFVASMVPHHQGAIDMAEAELRFGHNEKLHRIAQEIIVTQQQEIVAMHVAIGQPPK